ncbi:MAG: HAD hydrolase-like protein [Asgard group archaeon]|nr:HAD hydrolase-like protein [Asgard group archaeon]
MTEISNNKKSMKNNKKIPLNKLHLIFDLHGVLISKQQMTEKYDKQMVSFLQKQFKFEKDAAQKAINHANEKWLRFWEEKPVNTKKSILKRYEDANTNWMRECLSGRYYWNYNHLAAFLEYHVPTNFCCVYPEMKETLIELKNKGITLSVASSAHTRHTTGVLVGCELLSFFSEIIGLDNTHQLKSNKKFYEILFQIIETPPENSIYIGNSLSEIHFPKQLGAKTIIVTREITFDIASNEHILKQADLVLPDLCNLFSILINKNLILIE